MELNNNCFFNGSRLNHHNEAESNQKLNKNVAFDRGAVPKMLKEEFAEQIQDNATETFEMKDIARELSILPETQKPEKRRTLFVNKLAIEEAWQSINSNALSTKTPVMILQELLSHSGMYPKYDLIEIQGSPHQPTFRYRVSCMDRELSADAIGDGHSKKEAKHAAARALIETISGVKFPEAQEGTPETSNDTMVAADKEINKKLVDDIGVGSFLDNPVGLVQEWCTAHRWPLPMYEVATVDGMAHNPLFTVSCSIFEMCEVGRGKTKKYAKRVSASKMWTRLKDQPTDKNDMLKWTNFR